MTSVVVIVCAILKFYPFADAGLNGLLIIIPKLPEAPKQRTKDIDDSVSSLELPCAKQNKKTRTKVHLIVVVTKFVIYHLRKARPSEMYKGIFYSNNKFLGSALQEKFFAKSLNISRKTLASVALGAK